MVAFALRAAAAVDHIRGDWLHNDEPAYLATATTLAETGRYLTRGSGTPEIIRGPAYSAFLALCFRLGGSPLGALLLQAAMACSAAVLLAVAFTRATDGNPRRAPALYAVVLALSPIGLLYDRLLLSECLATVLLALFFVSWLRANSLKTPGILMGPTLLAGVAYAGLVLTKPAFLPLLPLLATVQSARRTGESLSRAILVTVVAVAMVGPWAARNYSITGRWVPVGIGGGAFLYLGTLPLGPHGVPILSASELRAYSAYLAPDTPVDARIRADGDLGRWGLQAVKDRPAQIAQTMARRVLKMWATSHLAALVGDVSVDRVPRSVRNTVAGAVALVVLLAIVGSVQLLGRHGPAAIPWVAIPIYVTVVHAPLGAGGRYVVPAWPYVLCLATYAMTLVARCWAKPWISSAAERDRAVAPDGDVTCAASTQAGDRSGSR